jgi:hypothetical protein
MPLRDHRVVDIEIEADELVIGGVSHLTKASVAAALRSIAVQLEAAGSVPLAPEQFRVAASAFEDLRRDDDPPRRRRLFGRRPR